MRPLFVTYRLPDGTRIEVKWELCRERLEIRYTLSDGRIVTALRVG
jgi:hypothetical protein